MLEFKGKNYLAEASKGSIFLTSILSNEKLATRAVTLSTRCMDYLKPLRVIWEGWRNLFFSVPVLPSCLCVVFSCCLKPVNNLK